MKTIDNDIKMGQLKRAYLLYGEERYLIRQYRDKLVKAMVPEGDTMNFTRFEGTEINQKEIIDLAETLPFFADRRVILIEDSGLFKARGGKSAAAQSSADEPSGDGNETDGGVSSGSGNETNVSALSANGNESLSGSNGAKAGKKNSGAPEGLADYLEGAPDTTYFLFVEDEIDKRSKLYKAINKIGNAVEFKAQTEETLSRWILGRLRREEKNITQEAYRLFIEKTGTDMENIDRELEKLICYCMEKDTITPQEVEAVTTEQTQNKVFDMVDAITSHRQKKALDLYYDLLALKEPPMRILYLITRQFHILMTVKAMTNQGFGNKDIASKAGCPEWTVKKYQAQCRAYSLEQLKGAVKDGTEFEEAVKTGRMNDQMAVELFIVQYSAQK